MFLVRPAWARSFSSDNFYLAKLSSGSSVPVGDILPRNSIFSAYLDHRYACFSCFPPTLAFDRLN